MTVPFRILAVTAMATMILVSGQTQAQDEKAAICAEAQERFQSADVPKPTEGDAVVLLYKYTFCPRELTVKAGTTVHFINVDKRTSHSVWFKEAGRDESERFFPEELWTITLQDAGRYPYLCGPHWEQEGMKGILTVEP